MAAMAGNKPTLDYERSGTAQADQQRQPLNRWTKLAIGVLVYTALAAALAAFLHHF